MTSSYRDTGDCPDSRAVVSVTRHWSVLMMEHSLLRTDHVEAPELDHAQCTEYQRRREIGSFSRAGSRNLSTPFSVAALKLCLRSTSSCASDGASNWLVMIDARLTVSN